MSPKCCGLQICLGPTPFSWVPGYLTSPAGSNRHLKCKNTKVLIFCSEYGAALSTSPFRTEAPISLAHRKALPKNCSLRQLKELSCLRSHNPWRHLSTNAYMMWELQRPQFETTLKGLLALHGINRGLCQNWITSVMTWPDLTWPAWPCFSHSHYRWALAIGIPVSDLVSGEYG